MLNCEDSTPFPWFLSTLSLHLKISQDRWNTDVSYGLVV